MANFYREPRAQDLAARELMVDTMEPRIVTVDGATRCDKIEGWWSEDIKWFNIRLTTHASDEATISLGRDEALAFLKKANADTGRLGREGKL